MELKWMEVTDVIEGNTDNFENCIYLWRNKTNGHIYVGKAYDFRRRTREHNWSAYNENDRAYNHYIHNAIRKHGLESFEICILEEDLLEEHLGEREKHWIAYYDTFKNKYHYNMTEGGEGLGSGENHPNSTKVICITTGVKYGSIMEAERQTRVAKQNISKCCSGKYKSAGKSETGEKLVWMYLEDYNKLTEEEREEIKNKEVRRGGRKEQVICITTGDVYESVSEASRQTDVVNQNISACCNGNLKSAGTIDGKPAIWMFLDKYEELTEEEREEIKKGIEDIKRMTKQVICITTGDVYESAKEAERQTGISNSNISECCRGVRGRKSAGKINGKKLVWMFYKDYLEQNK